MKQANATVPSKYKSQLPQLDSGPFLTDGGMETTFVFHDGMELPHFASFPLLETARGRATLQRYFERYIQLALDARTGFVLESPTWRSNPDWGAKLGYTQGRLDSVNREAIAFLMRLRDEFETAASPMVISGCVGPRGDGYRADRSAADQAMIYHSPQVQAFASAGADLVSAITMTHVEEAIGITLAAKQADVPAVISFTVETDGRLPSGQPLGEAIEQLDSETEAYAAYLMLNCAHPTHFADVLDPSAPWLLRLRGLRANASMMSHEELDSCSELDDGNPDELGVQYRGILRRLPGLCVLGGCCGTDHRHVQAIRDACLSPRQRLAV